MEECALLLDYGAKQLSSAKRHPLHCAAGWNHPAVVRLLLERGASVDVKDDKGATPLECAKNHNDPDKYAEVIALLESASSSAPVSTP